jgi:hypothetical protein
MDVYLPPDLKPHERSPLVVFFHGGLGPEYKPTDWGMFQSCGRLVAAAVPQGILSNRIFAEAVRHSPSKGVAADGWMLDCCHYVWLSAVMAVSESI